MDKNKIENICGLIPDGFIKVTPRDSNCVDFF